MENIKNLLYTSVGTIARSLEKLQLLVSELIDRGELTQQEGKQIVDDFLANIEQRRQDFDSKVQNLAEEVLSKFDMLKNESIDKFKERIEDLENKFDAGEVEVIDAEAEIVSEAAEAVAEEKA